MSAESKGYYASFNITLDGRGETPTIHGNSFAIKASNVDFITSKQNMDTGVYGNENVNYGEKDVKLV